MEQQINAQQIDENLKIIKVPQKKTSRVCPSIYQAEIPKLKRKNSFQNHDLIKKEVKRLELDGFKAVFLRHKISQEDINQYLKLVKQISLGINSSDDQGQILIQGLITFHDIGLEEQALQFLHEMDYSLIKAKFYLIFPTFLAFNAQLYFKRYKPSQTLQLSDEEMMEKINQYMSFQNVSFNDEQEQVYNQQSVIKTRPHLNKLQYLLDLGKRKKFELPQNIKDSLDSLSKLSATIKKTLTERAEINVLRELYQQSQQIGIYLIKDIISQEMIFLEESLPKCEQWLKNLPLKEPISFKDLQNQVLDYRNLMIKSSDFKNLNDLYENCLECFDKICITKKTRREECASWSKTLELYYIIRNLKIECEEFRTYQKKVLEYQQNQEIWAMALEDKYDNNRIHKILKEMNVYPWQTDQVIKVSALCDYQTKFERVQKNLKSNGKFDEIKTDLEFLNEKFRSQELDNINQIFFCVENFYNQLEFFQNDVIKPDLNQIISLESLNKILLDIDSFQKFYTKEIYQYIDKKSIEYISILYQKIDLWKNELINKISFDQLLAHFYDGLEIKLMTKQMNDLFFLLKELIKWLQQANLLIQNYDKSFKSKYQLNTINDQKSLDQLLNLPHQALTQTKEYEILKILQKMTQEYNFKAQIFLELNIQFDIISYKEALELQKQGFQYFIQLSLGNNLPVEQDYTDKLSIRIQGFELKQEFAEINGKQQFDNYQTASQLQEYFEIEKFEQKLFEIIQNDSDQIKDFIINKWCYIEKVCRYLDQSNYNEKEKIMEEKIQKFMHQSQLIPELQEERKQADLILDQQNEFKIIYEFVFSDRRSKQKKAKCLIPNVKNYFLLNQTPYIAYLCKMAVIIILLYRSFCSKLAYPQHQCLKSQVSQLINLIDSQPQNLNDLQSLIINYQKLNSLILPLKILKNEFYYVQSFQQIVTNLFNAMPQLKLRMEITSENCFVEYRDDIQSIIVQYKGQGAKLRRRRNVIQNQVYCICRQGHDGIQDMMQCDNCEDWQIQQKRFHNDCIAIKPSQSKKLPTYCCMACCLRNRVPYQIESDQSDFKWHNYKKLSIQQFYNLYEQSLLITMDIPEKFKIQSLKQQIDSFILLAQKKIDIGVNIASIWPYDETQQEFDSSILDLIKWGIYLPIETEIFPKLVLLIQRRDYTKQMRRFLIPNQMTNHARNQFLKKDNSYLKMQKDEEIQILFNKISHIYQISIEQQKVQNLIKELQEYIKQKAESFMIRQILDKIHNDQLIIDNLENIIKSFNDFLQWEQQVITFLNPSQIKIGIQEIYQLKNKYDGLICSNVGLYASLMQEVLRVQEWMNTYLQWQRKQDLETAILLKEDSKNLRVQFQQIQDVNKFLSQF